MTNRNMLRILLGTAIILFLPLVVMVFTDEVTWTVGDFVAAGILLLGVGLLFEFVTSRLKNQKQKTVVGIVLFVLLAVVWVDLAVGIFSIPGFSGS